MTSIAASPPRDPIVRFVTGLGIHYAWVVAFVTFFAALVAAGAVGSVGVMLIPLQMEFGWTQAEISSAPRCWDSLRHLRPRCSSALACVP